LLDRKVARLSSVKYFANINPDFPVDSRKIRPVTDQPTGHRELTEAIDCRDRIGCRMR